MILKFEIYYFIGLFLVCQISEVLSAKILVINFIGTKSSKTAFVPLYEELAARGHKVTILSSFKPSKPVPNIREINGQSFEKTLSSIPNPFTQKLENKQNHPFLLIPQVSELCRSFLDLPEMKELLNESFDLIMLNAYLNECAFGLISHFNTSYIYISSMPVPSWINVFGTPALPSFNPHILFEYSNEMSFPERFLNVVGHIGISLYRNYYYSYKMEGLYREYFPPAPSVLELEKNVSLILMNSHVSYNYPKPLLPDMIEVGGMHCRPAKSLNKDLQTFLDESGDEGFIYFSMGSFIQTSAMPENIRNAFLNTFAKLKQRVLWKWETEVISDLPYNIMLHKWLPQQDILGHPKIRIFITHGGLLSTQEAIYHGVPLIGIPMFGDQDSNMRQSIRKGFALKLELKDIDESKLTHLIRRILNEPGFHQSAKTLSKIFRDDSDRPLDRAVFWTEYVLRHKGAMHIRSPARDLNFVQYHCIDVICTILSVLAIVISLVYHTIRFSFNFIFRSRKVTVKSAVRLKTKKNLKME